ncbi:ARF4 family protein [Megaselia abdita]
MGGSISCWFRNIFYKRNVRILMVGLDAAGKTTILYQLKLGEVVSTMPTIGFTVETVRFKNLLFNVWDIGGQDKIRPLWKYYYKNSEGLIFVVDCSDRDRIDQARKELSLVLREEEMKYVPLLVFANKQDLPNTLSATNLALELQLNESSVNSWYIQSTCALSGQGLFEGLDWLSQEILKKDF